MLKGGVKTTAVTLERDSASPTDEVLDRVRLRGGGHVELVEQALPDAPRPPSLKGRGALWINSDLTANLRG